MATIMTLGRQTKRFRLRGKRETLLPDFRDINLNCGFAGDAVNGAPKIRVTVSEVARGKPEQIKVEIIPPEGVGGAPSPGEISDFVITTADQPPLVTGRTTSIVADIAATRTATGDAVHTATVLTGTTVTDTVHTTTVVTDTVFTDTVLTDTVLTDTVLTDIDPDTDTPDLGTPDTGPGTSPLINDGRGPLTRPGFPGGDLIIDEPLPPIPPGGSVHEVIERTLIPGTDPTGQWKVRLHNLADEARDFFIDVKYPESVQRLVTTRVPFLLLDRAFSQALLLMRPQFAVNGGRARIAFTDEFKRLTGLGDIVASVDDRLSNINMETLTIRAGREPQFNQPAILIGLELEERGDEIDILGPNGNIDDMSMALTLVLHMPPPPTTDFFATAMMRDNGTVRPRSLVLLAHIDTNPELRGLWIRFLTKLNDILGDDFDDTVDDMVEKAKNGLNAAMRAGGNAYVQDVLTHLVERDHVIHAITADAEGLLVQHHAKPDRFNRPIFDTGLEVLDPTIGAPADPGPSSAPGTGGLSADRTVAAAGIGDGDGNGDTPVVTSRLRASSGPELPDITVATTAELVREGDVDHIVFLMMENRSFDHMLGYRALKGHQVNGITGQEENAIPDGNRPYRMKHLTRTFGTPSPGHDFDDAEQQIAGGAMSGFAESYMGRSSATDPGLAVSHYTEAELPMYEFIANNFAICDAWFSSHPGPTWPNRFCATTGSAPEVENFDLTDDRIGYFNGTSIFDMLTRFSVDWCYAEGNVSFLRMFDRYRLDVRNVIPYRDDFGHGVADTWESRVKAGRLPAVSYIDPRFIDIPPAFDANDDLPPTDLCRGQLLIKQIYELLVNAPTWPRTLFVITYDEHGGFFDHEPPPGTPGAADPSPQPKVHPDGADHLGVRVPALVVSPWVDAGTVISTVFDHTSIIKTILQRFAPDDHADGAAFGPRTEAANSLLDELRDSPRTDKPTAPDVPCEHAVPPGLVAPFERDDFHTAMRYLAFPEALRVGLVG